jgi:hypothetical protein
LTDPINNCTIGTVEVIDMPKIIKATEEEKAEYMKAQKWPELEPPLYGYVTISGQRCAIAYLGEGQGEPNYELFAPEGYSWSAECHSTLSPTLAELREEIRHAQLEKCDAGCPCGYGKAA